MATPVCTILGGPNGSGKSSLYRAIDPPGEFVNADIVARRINPVDPEAASLAAGRAVLVRLNELVEAGRDFAYETTLSSNQAVGLMRRAREAGYQVALVFVALDSADLNVERVGDRVRKGGHAIPEPVIRRRYGIALSRLAQAIPLAHESAIFDNSEATTRLLLRIAGNAIEENHLDRGKRLHTRIADAAAQALGLGAGEVLRTGRFD
ncbi:MAG: zeta toxin family protein [Methylorubrum populi]